MSGITDEESAFDDAQDAGPEIGQTADEFHCANCGYDGVMNAEVITDWVPYGSTSVPMTSLDDDLICPTCGSHNIEELSSA